MKAFILMPFSTEFDDIYKLGIKETAKELGVEAYRLDEELFDQGMLDKIYGEINSCDFIIADVSNKNPNVFYELGYAHALDKLCLLITSDSSNIPFDLKHRRHIVYGDSILSLKNQLATNINWAKEEILKNKNNPFEVDLKTTGSLSTTETVAEAELELTIDIENKLSRTSPEIQSIYIHSTKEWTILQDGRKIPFKKSDIKPFSFRYQVKPLMEKLPKKGWTQIKLGANRILAQTWAGDKIKDYYLIKGQILIEIVTEKETYSKTLPLSVSIDILPF
jgi:hypothetical protein